MIKKICSILLLVSFSTIVFSQTGFQRLIGGSQHERAQTVLNTFDNDYMINAATGSYGAGGIDAMLIKADLNGQIIWSNVYGTTEYDNSEFAIETADHGYVCVGRSEITVGAPTSAMMFKTDSAGNVLWSKSYGGINSDGFIHIIETAGGGFAAVGNSSTLSSGSNDILLVRTNDTGDTMFTRSYGTPENEAGSYILHLPDNGFLIAGRQTTNNGTKSDGVLLRTDSLGNQLWTKLYGDTMFEELTAVRQTPDGGFIAIGSSTGYGFGGFDILLIKTDSSGEIQWSKVFGGAASDAGYDIHITQDSDFIISGFTESLGYGNRSAGPDEANIFLMKTDSSGTMKWMQVYGDGLQDEAYRSEIAADGGFLIGGFTNNYLLNDSSQMIIIKTDSMGISGCHEESAMPSDTLLTISFADTLFTQLSGLFPVSNLTLITSLINTNNDDACLFSSLEKVNSLKTIAYPNPFSEELTIELGNNSSEVIITDVLGKIIFQKSNVKDVMKISTSHFSSGVYCVTIINYQTYSSSLLVK